MGAKLTPRQKQVVEHMRRGFPLVKYFEQGGVVHMLEGYGVVRSDVVGRMLDAGIIRDAADAMFGIGQSLILCDDYRP